MKRFLWIVIPLLLIGMILPALGQSWAGKAYGAEEKKKEEKKEKEEKEKKEEEKEKKEKKEDRYLAVKGGDFYTLSGPVIRGGILLAKNGKIVEISPNLTIPEKAEILDASGMRIYPGLVAVQSSGIVGREPPEHTTDPFSLNMTLALASGLTTVVTGNTAAKLTYGSLEDMVVRRKLFTKLRYRARDVKGKVKLREDLEKVRDYLRKLRQYEDDKAAGKKDIEEPDKKWLKGNYAEYLKLLKGENTALLSGNTARELKEICSLVGDFGIKAVINGGYEGWSVATDLGRAGAKLIISPRQKVRPNPRLNRPSGSSIENARILYEHGVPFAIIPRNPRVSLLGGIAGRDILFLPIEACFAVRGGLPDRAALEAITIEAARLLGIDDRVGSLEPGKDADLIVCDGELLHYNTMVQWSVVNGRIAYDKQKDSLFRHIRPRGQVKNIEIPEFWPRPFGEMLLRTITEEKESEVEEKSDE